MAWCPTLPGDPSAQVTCRFISDPSGLPEGFFMFIGESPLSPTAIHAWGHLGSHGRNRTGRKTGEMRSSFSSQKSRKGVAGCRDFP